MRFLFAIGTLAALTGCAPQVPDSGAGVGFGSMEELLNAQEAARIERESALSGQPVMPVPVPVEVEATTLGQPTLTTVVPEPQPPLAPAPQVATVTPIATPAPLPGVRPTGPSAASTTIADPPTTVTGALQSGAGISDEQSFDAVSERESIESDAARIAANRARYTVIQPTALPTREGQAPNIVQYALLTQHPVGVQLYNRLGLVSQNRHLRNCASFASNDLAQQAFLANGGPDRDRGGLDPDGDGYACRWDPTPFRVLGN
ncbi:MAG: hypothetical protein AAF092_07970 [Pseudomonadota bacterium]